MNYLDSIKAVSYIGDPVSNTAMFLSAKAGKLLMYLNDVNHCLIFAEHGLKVPEKLQQNHHFEFSDNPQLAYYQFTKNLEYKQIKKNRNRIYTTLDNGAKIGENVKIGNHVTIEPFVLIDHDCEIGDDTFIGSGTIIRRSKISKDVHIAEHAVIGADAFNLIKVDGNLINMPTLGKVEIEKNSYIGSHTIISAGLAGYTRVFAHAQIDANCHIHHDCQISENSTICTNVKMGGFVRVGDNCFIGIGSQIKNRIKIGQNSLIGIGSVVIRDVINDTIVYGNPAK